MTVFFVYINKKAVQTNIKHSKSKKKKKVNKFYINLKFQHIITMPPINNKEQDDIDETSFSKNDDFEMIDYVLVYQKYSNRKLKEYRNIYLKNLVTFGLKLRNVLLKNAIIIFSLFYLFLLLIK